MRKEKPENKLAIMECWPSLKQYAKTVSMPGGKLFYYDSNENSNSIEDAAANNVATNAKPSLILIHGLGDEADTWRHIFQPLLNSGYRVIALDLPGFGRSIWKGKIDINCHCKIIRKLIDLTGAASAENPAVLIGSSLGAGIAELIAFRQPEHFNKLILISGCFPFEYRFDKNLFLSSLPFLGKRWYRGFRVNHEEAWKTLFPFYSNLNLMNSKDKEFLRKRVIARVENENQEKGYFATLRSMNSFLPVKKNYMIKKLKVFSGEINLLWGGDDHIFSSEKTHLLQTLRPKTKLAFIQGAGHLPHQEKPAETVKQILSWLSKV